MLRNHAPRGEAGFEEGFLALCEDLGTARFAADSRVSGFLNIFWVLKRFL